MLPDYPKTKRELESILNHLFRLGRSSMLMEIREVELPEGDQGNLSRSDGTRQSYGFKTHSSKITLKNNELLSTSWPEVCRRMLKAGQETGISMFTQLIQDVDEITRQTGNRVDAEGNLSPTKFFELFRKVEIDFDNAGNPRYPTLVGGEIAQHAVERVLRQIFDDPQLTSIFSNIIAEQRERHRDRESRRQLVG